MSNHHSADAEKPTIQLDGSIWLGSGGQKWGSERRMALLAAIHDAGSITAAAKKIGISYKAAWDAVDSMNNLAGEPLVRRSTGGPRGGGACLTPRAHELLNLYRQLSREHERFMARLAPAGSPNIRDLELIQHMMIQTSARNKFLGTVDRIQHGAVNDEVVIKVASGTEIVASITSDSVQNLDLHPGKRALAFIKASSIMVGLPEGPLRLSARNQLPGRIVQIAQGAVNAEISIELAPDSVLAAMISRESVCEMNLLEGQDAYAIFKASSVMLGVLD